MWFSLRIRVLVWFFFWGEPVSSTACIIKSNLDSNSVKARFQNFQYQPMKRWQRWLPTSSFDYLGWRSLCTMYLLFSCCRNISWCLLLSYFIGLPGYLPHPLLCVYSLLLWSQLNENNSQTSSCSRSNGFIGRYWNVLRGLFMVRRNLAGRSAPPSQ